MAELLEPKDEFLKMLGEHTDYKFIDFGNGLVFIFTEEKVNIRQYFGETALSSWVDNDKFYMAINSNNKRDIILIEESEDIDVLGIIDSIREVLQTSSTDLTMPYEDRNKPINDALKNLDKVENVVDELLEAAEKATAHLEIFAAKNDIGEFKDLENLYDAIKKAKGEDINE